MLFSCPVVLSTLNNGQNRNSIETMQFLKSFDVVQHKYLCKNFILNCYTNYAISKCRIPILICCRVSLETASCDKFRNLGSALTSKMRRDRVRTHFRVHGFSRPAGLWVHPTLMSNWSHPSGKLMMVQA